MLEFLIFNILMSYLFMSLSVNPLSLGILIIFQSMMFSIIICFLSHFSWFSFLIFIIYLGGILMIFSYVISLNYKSLPLKDNKMLITFIYIVLITFFLKEYLLDNSFTMIYFFKKMDYNIMLFSSFSMSFNKMSIMLLIFLLYVMIAVVFLIESSKGSMRSI